MKLKQTGTELYMDLKDLLDFAGSTWVTAEFTKKDGTHRVLTFNPRMGREGTPMRNDLTVGGSMPYNPKDFSLLPVVDIRKYRRGEPRVWASVNFRTLTSLKVRGHTFEIQ